jgi:SRSO17 transposase
MSMARAPVDTVAFIDQYCALYHDQFPDVRSFEHFKLLHLGLVAELRRKSLPAIAKAVGLHDGQELHHFLALSPWKVADLRHERLKLTKRMLHNRSFVLCLDETGDKKKGKTTDYAARQYIGNLGKLENGLVSVNAYGVLDNVTFPLLFQVFKPQKRLKSTDEYKTKPELAVLLIKDLIEQGFRFDVVLADSLYGESSHFVDELLQLKLKFVVAIRSNHGVWLAPGQRVRYTRWRTFDREFSDGETEVRSIREIIFGKRGTIRYYQLTTDTKTLPQETTQFLMTNLDGDIRKELGNIYGLRTWIEYGFKQIKNELGWADYRVTDYDHIERWWEIVCCTYLMISLQAPIFRQQETSTSNEEQTVYARHEWWDTGSGWKNILNNVRLITQPYIFCCLLLPWLKVFDIPTLYKGFRTLINAMNGFQCYIPI